MSDVTRYAVIETALCIGGSVLEGEVEVVRAVDFDTALAREDFLECELQIAAKYVCEVENREAALREELVGVMATIKFNEGKNHELQQRLAAAEQRNAKMEELLRDMRCHPQKRCAAFIAVIIDLLEAIKLTESGASE